MPDRTPARFQWLALVVLSFAIAFPLGLLTQWPHLQVVEPGHTELKLVIRYSGKLAGECRALGSDEVANLPPNMRQAMICPREKFPLYAELAVNDKVLYQQDISPAGLQHDGVIAMYRQFEVPTGNTRISLRIRDDATADAFTHVLDQALTLSGDRVLTVQFTDSGFRVRGV